METINSSQSLIHEAGLDELIAAHAGDNSTGEAYTFNEMVALINDALGTDIDPVYIECLFDGYVHDTMADYSTFYEATGWEPDIDFDDGVELV